MRLAQLLPFLTVVALIDFGGHYYIGRRLLGPVQNAQGWQIAVWAFLLFEAIFIPASFAASRVHADWANAVQWIGWVLVGVWSVLLMGVITRDLILLAVSGVGRLGGPELDAGRRSFLVSILDGSVLAGTAAIASAAAWRARQLAKVVEVDIPIDGLHPSLQGFKIAQISDLHVGATVSREQMEAVTHRVNELDADLVAVTGDLVDGSVKQLRDGVAPLGELKGRHGTWFVTGNHEYYSGVDSWLEHVRGELGWTALTEQHELIEHDGAKILVAGVTDATASRMHPTHRCSPSAACEGAPDADFKLMLAHQPEAAPEVDRLGFHLQLSGHTHGGQYFPYAALIHLVKKWVAGLYRVGNLHVYVNRGTTYWGPPLRLGSPQEITLLTLRQA